MSVGHNSFELERQTMPRTLIAFATILLLTSLSLRADDESPKKTAPTQTQFENEKSKSSSAETKKSVAKKDAEAKEADKNGWMPLFNGKNLDNWEVTNFGGEGEVYVEDGEVVITQGADLSGINSTRKDIPKVNYEIQLEAQRAEGSDFFVGVTFPIYDSYCSFICGGWGGGVCGISSIDGSDASENETTTYLGFTNKQWYKVRIVVTEDRLQAWLDKTQIADVETKDRKFDVRFEVDLSKPLGLSTYQSTAKIRNARIRRLPNVAVRKAPKKGAEKTTE